MCPSMRNPSGGAPQRRARSTVGGKVSIDEKPVRRCAFAAPFDVGYGMLCPSMRNPSGGAPEIEVAFGKHSVGVHR